MLLEKIKELSEEKQKLILKENEYIEEKENLIKDKLKKEKEIEKRILLKEEELKKIEKANMDSTFEVKLQSLQNSIELNGKEKIIIENENNSLKEQLKASRVILDKIIEEKNTLVNNYENINNEFSTIMAENEELCNKINIKQ